LVRDEVAVYPPSVALALRNTAWLHQAGLRAYECVWVNAFPCLSAQWPYVDRISLTVAGAAPELL